MRVAHANTSKTTTRHATHRARTHDPTPVMERPSPSQHVPLAGRSSSQAIHPSIHGWLARRPLRCNSFVVAARLKNEHYFTHSFLHSSAFRRQQARKRKKKKNHEQRRKTKHTTPNTKLQSSKKGQLGQGGRGHNTLRNECPATEGNRLERGNLINSAASHWWVFWSGWVGGWVGGWGGGGTEGNTASECE